MALANLPKKREFELSQFNSKFRIWFIYLVSFLSLNSHTYTHTQDVSFIHRCWPNNKILYINEYSIQRRRKQTLDQNELLESDLNNDLLSKYWNYWRRFHLKGQEFIIIGLSFVTKTFDVKQKKKLNPVLILFLHNINSM